MRERLGALEPAALRARLEAVDPPLARKLHPNDLRRTIRAIEVFELTGKPMSEHQTQWDASHDGGPTDRTLIGIEWPVELINPRINARVKEMFSRGLLEEARGLFDSGKFGPQACEALGYKQLISHFEGRCTLDEAIEAIKIETRRFAKNQRTWARRLRLTPGACRIDAATVPLSQWSELVLDACSPSTA
ncbi:MAG: tRNA dimethylallyltransferase [Planctomycetota bacterium]|nr:tRNA dimethylallyltransferase [Planctomycetota bacterium]